MDALQVRQICGVHVDDHAVLELFRSVRWLIHQVPPLDDTVIAATDEPIFTLSRQISFLLCLNQLRLLKLSYYHLGESWCFLAVDFPEERVVPFIVLILLLLHLLLSLFDLDLLSDVVVVKSYLAHV